jgi:hypothetical protein
MVSKALRLCFFAVQSVKILFSCAYFCGRRLVDVAQICNLLYRRIAFGRSPEHSAPFPLAAAGGLKIRDTAECNSALLWLRLGRAKPLR